MPKIESISRIPDKAVELLEAVGYLDVFELRETDIDDLVAELNKANQALQILPGDLSKGSIEQWLEWAGEEQLADSKKQDAAAESPKKEDSEKSKPKRRIVNLELDEDMMQMLAFSPVAEPLDPRLMADEDLSLDELTDGVLLNHCDHDVKINIMTTLGRADSVFRQDEAERTGLNASRIRNFDDLDSSVQHVRPLERGPVKDTQAVSADLNEGVNPKSRKFIKGVFHPQGEDLLAAAGASLMFAIILTVNIASLLGLFIYREQLRAGFVMAWVIGLLVCLVGTAFFYAYFGSKARCVVCRQPPLLPKMCTKHKKAHHVKGIGYILPTALQLLLYKWFYCTYCGTAIRLKK